MNTLRLAPIALASLVATACVTINVYFPAVAAERAADRIINDVWGESAKQPADERQERAPLDADRPTSRLELPAAAVSVAMRTLELVVPAATASQADLNISSPAIRSLTQSMERRHAELKPMYDAGAIGLTNDGLLAVRDANAVPLQQRNQLRKLVADENADRNALYKEIAVANKHPEWEADIRATFAKRWIDKAARGWWYQDASGAWKQK